MKKELKSGILSADKSADCRGGGINVIAVLRKQYEVISKSGKNDIFRCKNVTFFLFCSKVNCGYLLEPPQQGDSNEYPQSMF